MTELQVVTRRKPRLKIYVRAAPLTRKFPTDAQVVQRLRFAEAARRARGKKGLAPDGLPWAAHMVKTQLKGVEAPKELKKERIPEWKRRLEALQRCLELAARLAELARH